MKVDPIPRILRIIAEHYALHGYLPTIQQVYESTGVNKQSLSTRLIKLSKVEEIFWMLKDAGVITEPGAHTGRPHLTPKGFPWIEQLQRKFCVEELGVLDTGGKATNPHRRITTEMIT